MDKDQYTILCLKLLTCAYLHHQHGVDDIRAIGDQEYDLKKQMLLEYEKENPAYSWSVTQMSGTV